VSGPPPEVAAVRSAVRASLADVEPGLLVLAAVSGGADSLALAAGLAFEAPRLGLRHGAVVVDHGIQAGSADVAAATAAVLRGLGFDPVVVECVEVAGAGGPEAAARRARYAALDAVAARVGAVAVLLGHTRDDQAETVLLGLARGSGSRSLAGMAAVAGPYRRPLLGLPRATTAACCAASGLAAWTDPHNEDPGFARVRVRRTVLPVMEEAVGPGVAEALARTASLLRDDDEALEVWAARVMEEASGPVVTGDGLDVAVLSGVPAAVRRRVLRHAATGRGASGGSLTAAHLQELDRLVADWHGQGPVDLPGGVRAERRCGRLYLTVREPLAEPAQAQPKE
jgi:tRNA(Ile)-lysidine synthase